MPKARAPRNTDKNRFVNSSLVKKCYVHVNGKVGHIPPGGGHNWHPKLGGLKVTIHNRWGIESLLDDITRQLDMGWASKKLFTREGKPITEVSQISDEAHVVVSSGGKFMKEDVPFQMVKQGGGGGGGGRRGKSKRAVVTIEEWLHSWGGMSLKTSLSEAMKPHLFGSDSRQYAYLYQPKGPLLSTDDGSPGSPGSPGGPGSSGVEERGGTGDRGGDSGGEEGGGGGGHGGGGGEGGGGEEDEADMLANLIHALQHSSDGGGGGGRGGGSGGAPASSPGRGQSAGSSTPAAPFHDGSGSGSPFVHTTTSIASPSPPTSPVGSSNLGSGRGHSHSSGGGRHRFVFKPHAKPRVTQRTVRVKRRVHTRYVSGVTAVGG